MLDFLLFYLLFEDELLLLESSDLLLLDELLPLDELPLLLDPEDTELPDCLLLELLDPELLDELDPLDDPELLDCLLLDPTELDPLEELELPLDCLLPQLDEPELLDDDEPELSLRETEGLLSRELLLLLLTGSGDLSLVGFGVTISLVSLCSVACGLLDCASLWGCFSRLTLFMSVAFLSFGVFTSCLSSFSGRDGITL